MSDIIITIGKNEFSRIVHEGETVICITHITSGKKAILDNDTKLLGRIIAEIKARNKHLTPKGKYGLFSFSKSKQDIEYSSLAMIVFSELNNISLDVVKEHKIRHINRSVEYEDCRICNLYSVCVANIETSAFKFIFSKDSPHLDMLLKSQNKVIHFDKNADLFELLATPILTAPFMNSKRPQVRIKGLCDKQYQFNLYVSVFAYAIYNYGLTIDNHIQEIPLIVKAHKENRLQVEHLNGDIFDNRRYNLALVKDELNRTKKDIMKYLCAPYICNVVMGIDNKFRMMLGRAERAEDLLSGRLIILDTFADVVEVLSTYKKVYPTLFKQPSVSEHYVFREPIVSETLATMSAEYFTPYEKWLAEAEHLTRKG